MNQILSVGNDNNDNNRIIDEASNMAMNSTIRPTMGSTVNQNRSTKPKTARTGRVAEIGGIVKFFSIALIIFGAVFIGQGSYAIYKNAEDVKPENIPTVVIGRVNDRAIIRVENSIEISKIEYYWGDGEPTVIPINGAFAEEEIMLVGYDSVLNITVEDENGKRTNFQKPYKLTGVDITKPGITIETQNGSNIMKIIAKDETAMSYVSYQWAGEDGIVTKRVEQNGDKEIVAEVKLTAGKKEIKVIAEDANGNVEKKQVPVEVSNSVPKMQLIVNRPYISLKAYDKDGVSEIVLNINGKTYSVKDLSKNGARTEVETKPIELKTGNNTISVEVTNIYGVKSEGTTEIKNP
jgi:hypothetical protein